MGMKTETAHVHDAVLENLHPGEPFFVLRGQDVLAPYAILMYAGRLRLMGRPEHMIGGAGKAGNTAEAWTPSNRPD